MNILHVIGSMDPVSGGPCQGIRNSIKALEKQITYREVVSLDDPAASFLGKDSFPIHALGPGKGPWRYSARLIPWLEENLSRFNVVIINGLWLYNSYAVSKIVSRHKKKAQKNGGKALKLFVMPHGMLDPYFQEAPERKLKAVRNWIYWKLIEARVVNGADALLFTCGTELQLARKPFRPYKPKQEINVGYGIVAPPTYTTKIRNAFLDYCPEVENEPFLLFLSRIHSKKGVDLLVKAYAEGVKKSVNRPLPKLVIAGPGLDTAYGQKIKTFLAEEPKLQSKIIFPGMLTGDAKWGAFYGCEAFILPSHQENFGIAVAEALACRKPVLISNQVNIWKEIESEGGGIVAENNLQGTKLLLQSWIALAAEQKQQMQQKAYATYVKYFEVQQAAKKFLEAIIS